MIRNSAHRLHSHCDAVLRVLVTDHAFGIVQRILQRVPCDWVRSHTDEINAGRMAGVECGQFLRGELVGGGDQSAESRVKS